MDRTALNQLSKDALIALLLSQEARIAELERRLGLNSSNSALVREWAALWALILVVPVTSSERRLAQRLPLRSAATSLRVLTICRCGV